MSTRICKRCKTAEAAFLACHCSDCLRIVGQYGRKGHVKRLLKRHLMMNPAASRRLKELQHAHH